MASSSGITAMMERLRRKPLLFLLAVTMFLFYVTPFYYTKSPYVAFPIICKNASCQQASSAAAGMALSIWEDESNPNYVVYSPGCKIMEMNPFDKSVRKFLKRVSPAKCNQRFSKLEKQKLTIDEKIMKTWKMNKLNCCYRAIHRVTQRPDKYNKDADWEIKYGPCRHIPISGEGALVNDSFLKVECQGTGKIKGTVEFQASALPPKVQSEATRKKAEYWDERKTEGFTDPPSILVIGIDSISRMHMLRSLPRSREFLQQNDFIELKGYNKVGENTFPNIMAGFGGMGLDQYHSCWPNKSVKLDDCPYIWKNFSQLNYITAFLEDSPGIAIFNFAKLGFVLPPADYYMRPLAVAMHKHNGWYRGSAKASCVGGLNPTDFQAKFIKDFVHNMGKAYPYFLFSWFTSIGHDDFNGLKTADDTFYNLLDASINSPSANPDNTIIIFMSDHGYRFGSFRETFLGFYEESLPFFFFRLPPSMKNSYPDWYTNLKRNSKQLTSPLDLHSTLTQVLHLATSHTNNGVPTNWSSANLSAPAPYAPTTKQSLSFIDGIHQFLGLGQPSEQEQFSPVNLSNSSTFPYYYYDSIALTNETSSEPLNPQYKARYSFFEYVPGNRTCESSGIPQRYCMCGVTPVVSRTSSLSSHMGDIVVGHVNYLLQSVIRTGDCATLKFSKFLYGREVGHGDVWNNFHQFIGYKDYLVALEAGPSKAHFEAKIRILQNSTTHILGDITRINSYKGQSDCVSDFKLKPYCFCKEKKDHHKDKHGSSKTHKTAKPTRSSTPSIFSILMSQKGKGNATSVLTTSTTANPSSFNLTTIATQQGNNTTIFSTNRHIDKISALGKPK